MQHWVEAGVAHKKQTAYIWQEIVNSGQFLSLYMFVVLYHLKEWCFRKQHIQDLGR